MLKPFQTSLLLFALSSGALLAADRPPTVAPYTPGPGGPGTMPPANGYGMGGPGSGMGGPGVRHYGMGPGADGASPAPPPFAGVQFTEEQRTRINAMMAGEREAHQQRIERMQKAQTRLQQLYAADVWDTRAITAVYDEIFAEQRKTIEAMAKARNTVYAMLSDEQRAQMKQFELQMRRFGPPPQQ